VWGLSWILPARYASSTLILVEQPTMPKDYVVPNVNEDVQGRLQNITQQILSRTRLLHIIDELNLYPKDRRRLSPDEIVEQLRKDIEIELVKDAQKQVTAFRISYSAHDPSIAQQVTSKLTSLFINENLEVRQQQSEGTTKFLEDQLVTAQQSLEAQEEKIREFKEQHVAELPTQVASNRNCRLKMAHSTRLSNSTSIWRRYCANTRHSEGPPMVPKMAPWICRPSTRNLTG
jgi:uncharacterized protein involved in exopolysaccharide biosynthesis